MPRDDWARARRKDIARRAESEGWLEEQRQRDGSARTILESQSKAEAAHLAGKRFEPLPCMAMTLDNLTAMHAEVKAMVKSCQIDYKSEAYSLMSTLGWCLGHYPIRQAKWQECLDRFIALQRSMASESAAHLDSIALE